MSKTNLSTDAAAQLREWILGGRFSPGERLNEVHLAAERELSRTPLREALSLLVAEDDLFVLPAYPTEKTIDPTGCGDTFAGGVMGYLAGQGRCDGPTLRRAMARGSVIASFVIESFSVDALAAVTSEQIEQRLAELKRISDFD